MVILGKFRGFSEISSSGSSGYLIPDPEVIKEMGAGASCLSGYFLLNRGNDLGSGAEDRPRALDPYYLGGNVWRRSTVLTWSREVAQTRSWRNL